MSQYARLYARLKKTYTCIQGLEIILSLLVRGRKIQDEYRQSKAISSKTVFPHTKQTSSPTATHAGATLKQMTNHMNTEYHQGTDNHFDSK